jgi:tetratricopeptide (TPR) repeat protein
MNKRLCLTAIWILFLSCTPSQLLMKLQQRHQNDMQVQFGMISTATKTYIDSIVTLYGRDSTINIQNNDGWYFYSVGDLGRSISRFNRILYLDSLNPNPYWCYGLILSSKCEIDSALLFLKKAFDNDSTDVRLRCDLAYSLAVKASRIAEPTERKTEYKKAISEYLKQQPNFVKYPVLRLQFAEILMATGDSIGAKGQLRIAKKEKLRVTNADRIFKHIQTGGTLYSYICN